jgi:hypothetical protein
MKMPAQGAAKSGRPSGSSATTPPDRIPRPYPERQRLREGKRCIVHKTVNIMKSNHDEAYFIAMCMQVAAHRGGAVSV